MANEAEAEGYGGRLSILLPLLLAAVLYFASTTGRAVTDYDEGYYAQAAQNMAEHGDWVTPYADGIRFLEKPPLLYWLTAISFKIFGINEFALRLPTALAVIAIVWIVMLMALRAFNKRAAFIAGLCTAFCVGTYLFTRETLHDVWLVLFITLAIYAFHKWYSDSSRPLRPALLFYAAAAGAMMCKSLIGVAFPVGIIALFFIISREWPKWRTLHILPGSLLFLVLTVPWHWMAAIRNQGFLDFFFVGEQFLRFFGKREPPVLWSVPLLTFWALVLVWFFPWTAFLPAAFADCRKPADNRQRILVRLSIAWMVVILGFFSVTDRLEHYAFPVLPALSLLICGALSKSGVSKSVSRAFGGLAIIGILILALGLCAGAWFATGHGFDYATAGPADRLAEADFTIMADIPASMLQYLMKPAAVAILATAIGFPLALWFEMSRRRMHGVACLAVVMMIICGLINWSFSICEDLISSKKFAVAVAQSARPRDRLVVVGDYESANSLSFYQPLHIEVFDGLAYALIPGMKYPDAPKTVLTKQGFIDAWRSDARVFALIPASRIGELNPAGTEMLRILHRALIRNH